MNILDLIAIEIQTETGQSLQKKTEPGTNISYYQIQTQVIPKYRQYYNGTHLIIVKNSKNRKDQSFLTQPHKFIDLNNPKSIPEIIQTIKEYTKP